MKRIDRLFWICIIAAGLFLLFFPVISKYLDLRRSEDKSNSELRDLETKIKDLQKENYLIRHDVNHLEQLMRDELRLVKPGEVVYKLVSEDSNESKVKPDTLKPATAKNLPQTPNSTKLANR